MVAQNRELSYSSQDDSTDRRRAARTAGGSPALSLHAPPGPRPIQILIIENHQVVAEALEALCNAQPGLVVVGRLASVADAQSYSARPSPDVLIADYHLADGTGTEAVRALRQHGCQARVIFLTQDDGDQAHLAAVEAGASAFLHKSQAPDALVDAIRRVADGTSLIDPSTIASLLRKNQDIEAVRSALTSREKEVLRMVGEGIATRSIAARLGISYTTVRTHIRSIAAKLGCHSKLEAVVKARGLALLG